MKLEEQRAYFILYFTVLKEVKHAPAMLKHVQAARLYCFIELIRITDQDSSSSRYELRSPDSEFLRERKSGWELWAGTWRRGLEQGERVLEGLFPLACSFFLLRQI